MSMMVSPYIFAAAGDANFASVGLLMGFETAIVDESSNGFTVSEFGGIARTGTNPIIGAQSLLFDGSNDYISVPSNTALSIGGDFTIDFSVRWNTSVTSYVPFFSVNSGVTSTASWRLIKNGTSMDFQYYTDATGTVEQTVAFTYTFSANTDYNIRYSRVGTTLYFFVNGSLVASNTMNGTIRAMTLPLFVGRYLSNYGAVRMDEIRITKGVGRSTSSYTPSLPFPRS